MQKNIADIVSEICEAKVTGILTLSLNNHSSLFKIFFKDGSVYHLTHGTCKDRECLAEIANQEFVTGIFMPGAHLDRQGGLSPVSSSDVIAEFKRGNKTIEWTGQWDGRTRSSGTGTLQSAVVDSARIARMGEELVNIAGPIGPMVLAQAYDACGLKQGSPMTKTQFQHLVQTIGGKLPLEQRALFLAKFSL